MDYRQAGVDVAAGRDFVAGIKSLVEKTYRSEVLGGLGGFSGFFALPPGYRQPILVSGTDGVGTKLKIAQACNIHHTVGIDLVAMCVNDVLTSGAEPLFFLDYLATGKLQPDQLTQVVQGISQGCQEAGCALLGGETAEMPGFYPAGEYDLAGFCVGIVEKENLITPDRVVVGDVVVGLGSSGLHSNGFSLVRKIVADRHFHWHDRLEVIAPGVAISQTLGEWCLTPTRIYVATLLAALRSGMPIHGLAHITGGGIPENLPRCLTPHQSVAILPQSWPIPPMFTWLAQEGEVPIADMFHTFNMGIGMAVVVAASAADQALQWFQNNGTPAYLLGTVISGQGTIEELYK